MSENDEIVDVSSNEQCTNTNPSEEDFRTLPNANSRQSSEITAETVRMMNNEITRQVSSKRNEIKLDLNLQIRETIE